MNKATLIGRTTKDIELRQTTSGKSVCNFTLAVNRDFKNADGEYDTDFITCVAYGSSAETISKWVHKGNKFCVVGRIQVRTYEKQGLTMYATEIIVESFEFLEPKKDTNVDVAYPTDFEEIGDDDELPFG